MLTRIFALTAALAALTACDKALDSALSTLAATTSFAADVQPLLDANCVSGCHDSANMRGDLVMEGNAYDALVDVPAADGAELDYIEPFVPEDSYLWHKVNGTQLTVSGGGGSAMPFGEDALSEDAMATLELWIIEGCPE